MDRTNAPGHVNHLFVAEDPATNRPPTEFVPTDFNAWQEELMAIIEAAGIVPSAANNAQVIAALNTMFAKISGATGVIRTLTPAGGARVRELGDIANAATVGGIEFGISYNCNIDPATGVWAGRDVADICWLEKWSDVGGVKEFWYAQNAAAGANPAWVKVFTLDMATGVISLGAAGTSAMHAARVDQLPAPYRNRFINGDMSVSQVNGTNAVTPAASSYPLDQWSFISNLASKLTFQQVADSPAGFKYSTKISVAVQTAPAAADYSLFEQPIEGQNIIDLGFGTVNAKYIAVSVWAKASVPGTYSCYARNAHPGTRSYVGTINLTANWSKQTVVLKADDAGAWATDNTAGLRFGIDLGSGANFNAAAGAWAAGAFTRTAGSVTLLNQAVGASLNMTGAQLEKVQSDATAGTDFEFIPFAENVRRCERYYETGMITAGVGDATNGAMHMIAGARFRAQKRAVPTVIVSSSQTMTPAGTLASINGGAGLTSVTIVGPTIDSLPASTGVSTGSTGGYHYFGYFSADARM